MRDQKSNDRLVKKLKKRIERQGKVRVAFLVVLDSVFPAAKLYERMLEDAFYEPFIVVIPDIARGEANMRFLLDKTQHVLSRKYAGVMSSYDAQTESFIDISGKCDLCISANPYSAMTHEYYTVEYLQRQGTLSLYVSYGYMPDYYGRDHIMNLPSLNRCWRVFADTRENYEEAKQYTVVRGRNVVLSGYCKMDALADVQERKRERKRIIIAPHHTVARPDLPLSNFLTYAEFFQKIPSLYPDIDWVFRPHPYLYSALCQDQVWGKERTARYFEALQSFPNLSWQDGGDYFDTFVHSDALIHDCSSFLVEYMFTGHPTCYMLRGEDEIDAVFTTLGKNCLEHCYKAFNEQHILDFIDRVVLAEDDPHQIRRMQYVDQHLKLHYPHVTEFILNHIKAELL